LVLYLAAACSALPLLLLLSRLYLMLSVCAALAEADDAAGVDLEDLYEWLDEPISGALRPEDDDVSSQSKLCAASNARPAQRLPCLARSNRKCAPAVYYLGHSS
jgi:hypothetical protein